MHNTLIVYLAGPMAGLTVRECREWRIKATSRLQEAGFTILDPTRELLGLSPDQIVAADADDKRVVFHRDRFDATRADILIVNLLGAKSPSIGTLFEMAWAHLSGKFIVTLVEDKGNPHLHTFVKEASSLILDDLDEARAERQIIDDRLEAVGWLRLLVRRTLCSECGTWWYYDAELLDAEPTTCMRCRDQAAAELRSRDVELDEKVSAADYGLRDLEATNRDLTGQVATLQQQLAELPKELETK